MTALDLQTEVKASTEQKNDELLQDITSDIEAHGLKSSSFVSVNDYINAEGKEDRAYVFHDRINAAISSIPGFALVIATGAYFEEFLEDYFEMFQARVTGFGQDVFLLSSFIIPALLFVLGLGLIFRAYQKSKGIVAFSQSQQMEVTNNLGKRIYLPYKDIKALHVEYRRASKKPQPLNSKNYQLRIEALDNKQYTFTGTKNRCTCLRNCLNKIMQANK